MGSQPPSSLSWRVTSLDSAVRGKEDQHAADQKERQPPVKKSHSTSSIAMGMLPAISIAVPGAASSSSNGGTETNRSNPGSTDAPSTSKQTQEEHEHHHSIHNPFTIGPLRKDGRMESRHHSTTDGEGDEAKPSRRRRTRDKLAKAGRSLSPFNHRRKSLSKLPGVLGGSWTHLASGGHLFGSKQLTPQSYSSAASSGETSEKGEDFESESDADSIASGKGLQPRSMAFGRGGKDDHDGSDDDDWDADFDRERRSGDAETDDSSRLSREGADSFEEEEDDPGARDPLLDFDDATIDNTLFNAGCLDLHNAWQNNRESIGEGGWYPADDDPSWGHPDGAINEEPAEQGYDQSGEVRTASVDAAMPTSPSQDPHARLPNIILPSFKIPEPKRQGSKYIVSGNGPNAYSLVASRPIFARNRCTITLVHGEYEKAVKERATGGGRGPKKWIVASDGSEESSYAIEWTIGTVLRDGDETLIVSVMETSEKLDPTHKTETAHAKAALKEHQDIRQNMAVVLARQATALLQRTRLAVKISCQALHAKHSRHMLLDLIDFYGPTMVIVGSRGLGSLKGILLGSTSHYLVQKSSCPVMVARKRLQLPALPRGKSDVVSSVRRRHIRLDEAAIEKKSKVGEESDTDTDNDTEETKKNGDREGYEQGTEDKAEGEETPADDLAESKEKELTDAEVQAKRRQEGEQAVAAKQMSRSFHSATEPSPEDALRDLNKTNLRGSGDLDQSEGTTLKNEVAKGETMGEEGGEEEEEEEESRSRALNRDVSEEEGSSDQRGRSRSRLGP
ncbi:hypothetical protein BCV69DRAFT_280547 [Microstroma glucosiphilum]|uniref:UspA domain-containing protein n=1 Tax=Pseudomicrostroma glucosiphilum TaxID=1684307 RepID=A0A316UCH8_9BASI|nr:hypothetical protein BCV69DRAFT_280547 [Pseudomicrostroma glucosiphilum]PWN22937.1 hypothetical protein BCV69DRAFT_280547 [Pseudomicrostroma glucosiphilum]